MMEGKNKNKSPNYEFSNWVIVGKYFRMESGEREDSSSFSTLCLSNPSQLRNFAHNDAVESQKENLLNLRTW